MKKMLPQVCLPWPCGPLVVSETHQLAEDILRHFQGKQSPRQPLYMTAPAEKKLVAHIF